MTTTIVTYTPREAGAALAQLARRSNYRRGTPHGGRARYEPNLTPTERISGPSVTTP